jgi:acetyl coenzyme A synthetase (ADP forming)-like protein
MTNNHNIKYLFEPRSIAIVGASAHKGKIGYAVISNIITSNYQGKVYPINPQGGEVLGLPMYKTINDLPNDIDLVCIAIPAKLVFDAVKNCADKGFKFAAIISSGFSEIGNLEEENNIVQYATARGLRIVGPNMFGIYSSMAPVNATFGPADIAKGNVAVITQSGALGIALIGKTKAENIGLSTIVSVGNKADINESDLLEYLENNEQTRVIFMYIEGIKNGERLFSQAKAITRKKPIVIIKSGRSRRGAMAAASHTGSLAGEDKVFDDIARQCGLIRAENIQEALDWCKFVAAAPEPKGENSVIVTNGGGIGVMATDACEKYKINLYDDLPTLKKMFSSVIPEFGSAKNPIDMTGQATAEDYDLCLNQALKNDDIHSIICIGCETALFDPQTFKRKVEERFTSNKPDKPIVISFLGGTPVEMSMGALRTSGYPVFSDLYQAVSALGSLYRSHRFRNESSTAHMDDPAEKLQMDVPAIQNVIRKVRAEKRQFMLPYEANIVTLAAGIPMPQSAVVPNLERAIEAADKIGYPVVMKIVSKDIIHKSDAGGIALDLLNKKEVTDAFEAIMHNCRAYNPQARIEGVEIAEMITTGTETIIGARCDKIYGPIVMFGLGGIYVEVMKDVSFRSFPMSRNEALTMIKETKSYPILLGVRGEAQKDIEGVVDTVIKLGAIVKRFPDISDIEVNPVVVYELGKGVKALDVRILLSNVDRGGEING